MNELIVGAATILCIAMPVISNLLIEVMDDPNKPMDSFEEFATLIVSVYLWPILTPIVVIAYFRWRKRKKKTDP